MFRLYTLLALLGAAAALSLSNDVQRQIGGIGLAAVATLAPLQSSGAAETVTIEADFPKLIQVAKDNKDVLIQLGKQSVDAIKITKIPRSWGDRAEFVRDAGAGDAVVVINGVPFDISLLSEKGGVDITVATDKGELALVVSSELLPKLPLFEKRYTPATIEDAATLKTERLEAAVSDAPRKPFLDQPFFLNLFDKGWTNKNVLGSTSLGVGAAYGVSYAYFEKSKADEEEASRKKKEAAAAKRKANAAKKQKPAKKAKATDAKPQGPQASDTKAPTAVPTSREPSVAPVKAVSSKTKDLKSIKVIKKPAAWYKPWTKFF